VELKGLEVVDKLSKGQFGDLFLVRDKHGHEYVAKTLSKHELE
jgi:hypothetical protein